MLIPSAGLLNHSRVAAEDWEGRFRCFAYANIYDGYKLAMSGEAMCNLYSAKEGDRTMTLKRGELQGTTFSSPNISIALQSILHIVSPFGITKSQSEFIPWWRVDCSTVAWSKQSPNVPFACHRPT